MTTLLPLTASDLATASELWDALIHEVNALDAHLSGGKEEPLTVKRLRELRTSRLGFGDPQNDNLRRLHSSDFETLGSADGEKIRRQMFHSHDFYAMSLNVNLIPAPGAQLRELECHLDLGPPSSRPLVESIQPAEEWREVLSWGAGLNVKIDPDLKLSLALRAQQTPEQILPVHLATRAKASGIIVVNDYRFSLGRFDIIAVGPGSNFARWRITKPELARTTTFPFVVVFKVPQGIRQLELTGTAAAFPSFQYLTQQVSHVFEHLSQRFRDLFSQAGQQGANRLPLGIVESWTLQLPE